MTPEKLSQIEAKLNAAVIKAQELGQSITFGVWGLTRTGDCWKADSGCLCPMGALLLNQKNLSNSFRCDAATQLDIEVSEVDEFVFGFDDTFAACSSTKPMWLLGYQFRQRLLYPKTKSS